MRRRPTHETVAGSRYLALRKLAREQDRSTAELLQLYALEGFLARLACSQHRERLVLKGGMLLAAFDLRRPTRDIDFLALRVDNDESELRRIVAEVASVARDDGLVFLLGTLASSIIRDDDIYPGVRVHMRAELATARLVFRADINVGDPVLPGPRPTPIPTLLGSAPIEVMAYPKAMVIAEKLVTVLQRGRANTRWRDFADLYTLLGAADLDEDEIIASVRAVARHRGTPLPPLSESLAGMAKSAQARWSAWRRQHAMEGRVPEPFEEILATLDTRTRRWLGTMTAGRSDDAGGGEP